MAKTTEEEMTQKPCFGEIIEEDMWEKKKNKETLEKRIKMSTRLYMKILVDTSH